MSYEPLEPPRSDPPITVEAAPTDDAAAEWSEPVVTRPEYHQCQHRLYYGDLNPKGRLTVLGAQVTIWSSWLVIVLGAIFGIGGLLGGLANDSMLLAVGSLLMVCSAVLQVVGAVGLASTWRRPHRPNDVVIGLAAIGYLLLLLVVGMLLAATKLVGFAIALVPFAFVLWQLISFRGTLYWSGTCPTFPGFPPAIRALLQHDPGPFGVIPESKRFSIADCPHRLDFGKFRRAAQVMSIVNLMLLLAYVAAILLLMAALSSVDDEREATASAVVLVLPLVNFPAFHEINVRSKRYHRAPLGVYVGAFTGYAATLGTVLWLGSDLYGPVALGASAMAAYWAYVAAYAMKALPPRSACATLREPPPAIQKLLKAW